MLDRGQWSGYQKLLVFGTALTIILDGLDNQLLPNALPTLMREWSLPRSAFTTVLAMGPLGMVLGGALGGWAGDRIGRRTALLGSVLSFAVLTAAIAGVSDVFVLGVLRFLAGVGLGGAMPNAANLTAEYVPARQRPFAVTLTVVCIPLGGTLAALLSSQILPTFGWRTLFAAGGLAPLVLATLLFRVLPESPRYLANRRERWPELTRVLRRMGHAVPAESSYTDVGAHSQARHSIGELFRRELRSDTLGLSGAFFFCLMANYIGFLLIPAMLAGVGFTQSSASNALAALNFGGVGGAIVGALALQRLGSRVTMLGMSAAAVLSALVMSGMQLDPQRPIGLLLMFAVTGGLLNAVQTTMYALAAHVYPTGIRGTGVGAAVGFGRIGNVLASFVGGWALDAGGSTGYFSSWAVTMTLVLICLAVVTRHIPGRQVR
jgi:AAHS family 4-hydroxybenzoate transporter-like MFS transporter